MKRARLDERDVKADGVAPCASTGAAVRATKSAVDATRAAKLAMIWDMCVRRLSVGGVGGGRKQKQEGVELDRSGLLYTDVHLAEDYVVSC